MITLLGSLIVLVIVALLLRKLFRNNVFRYVIFKTEPGLIFFLMASIVILSISFEILFSVAPTLSLASLFYELYLLSIRLAIVFIIIFLESIIKRKYLMIRTTIAFALFGVSAVSLLLNEHKFVRFLSFWEAVRGPVGTYSLLESIAVDLLIMLLMYDIYLVSQQARSKLENENLARRLVLLTIFAEIVLFGIIAINWVQILDMYPDVPYSTVIVPSMIFVATIFYFLIGMLKLGILFGTSHVLAIAVFDAETYSIMYYKEFCKDCEKKLNIMAPLVITLDWLKREFNVDATALNLGEFVVLVSMGNRAIVVMFLDTYNGLAEALVHIIRVRIENAIDYELLKGLSLEEAKWRVAKIEIHSILDPIFAL